MQAPVTYAITTTQPIRCGGVIKSPYTIINLSVDFTCWLSQNAGMRVGEGIPLYPGTSLAWQYDGDFYAISDGGDLQIIATVDAVDWEPNPIAIATAIINAGVIIIDQPEVAFNGTLDAVNLFTSDRIDISRRQSVVVALGVDTLGPGNDNWVDIKFFTDAGAVLPLAYKTVEFTNLFAAGGIWLGTIPVQGSHMEVTAIDSSTVVDVIVVLSNRPQEGIEQSIIKVSTGPDTNFHWATGGSIANGATAAFDLPPWYGEIQVNVAVATAAAVTSSYVRIERKNPGGAGFIIFQYNAFDSVTFTVDARVACAGDSLRVVIQNSSGGNWTNVATRITPVSGFGSVA